MQFQFDHNNLNVLDLERSVEFYKKALGLQELRRTEAGDHSFTPGVFRGLAPPATGWSSPGCRTGKSPLQPGGH